MFPINSPSRTISNLLSLDQESYLSSYHQPAIGPVYDYLLVGAIITSSPPSSFDEAPKILLLKRARHQEDDPNLFELPSGKVEKHETLGQALARNVKEQTGLRIVTVEDEGQSFEFGNMEVAADGGEVRDRCLQVNFWVTVVEAEGVRCDPDEHCEARWVGERELGDVGPELEEGMRAFVDEELDEIMEIRESIMDDMEMDDSGDEVARQRRELQRRLVDGEDLWVG